MGDLVERRIFHIVAAPTTYQNKQIGFDGSVDADLGFKMFCGRDDVGAITKMLAKDKPARVQSFRILNGQFSWNFDETGDVGTLSVADSVTSLGKLEFSDDLLSTGGIKARFADNATEASDFLSDFGDMSIMGAMSWLKDNPISGLNEDQLVFGASDGSIDQSSALQFNSNSQLLIGTGPDKIGTTANSLFVGGKIEIDGASEFDGWAYFNAGALLPNDIQLGFGNTSSARIEFDTDQTLDALMIGTDTTSRTLLIADRSAMSPSAHNFALPAMSDPTIAIMAADQDNDKGMRLSWNRIAGGDTISIGASVGSVIALNGNSGGLSLTGDMDTSLVLGPGTVNSDRSLIAGISFDIGQGTGHAAALGESLLCLGTQLTIDAQHGSYIGTYLDIDGCDFSSALGQNIEMSHDYATARGRYVTTVAKGARHYGMDRYNSVNGTAEGIDGLTLVGESTGDETVTLHGTFLGSEASINLPDGIMGMFEIEVISAVFAADSSDNGYRIYTRRIIAWNNAGFGPWRFETANQTEIAASNATWSAAISATGDGSGNFNIQIVVSGTTGSPTITHVAKVNGLLSQTSLTASS